VCKRIVCVRALVTSACVHVNVFVRALYVDVLLLLCAHVLLWWGAQATLTAAQAALTADIDLVGPSTYYGTTDAYRRSVAAGLLYKVRRAGACPQCV
jgi:hypothetical protein